MENKNNTMPMPMPAAAVSGEEPEQLKANENHSFADKPSEFTAASQEANRRLNTFLTEYVEVFTPLVADQDVIKTISEENVGGKSVRYVELTDTPIGVNTALKKHQLSGVSFLKWLVQNGAHGILGDEMGLGKTLQVLALFQHLKDLTRDMKPIPHLIICPVVAISPWVDQARRFCPKLKVLRLHGPSKERKPIKDRISRHWADESAEEVWDIVLTSYETLVKEDSWFYQKTKWRCIILDEGHRAKNSNTSLFKALSRLRSIHKFILTGTPVQNNLMELHSLLRLLYPQVFDKRSEEIFGEGFNLARGKVDSTFMSYVKRLLEVIMLRRTKDSPSVGLDLPPKQHVHLYLPMTNIQRDLYIKLISRERNFLNLEAAPDDNSSDQESSHVDTEHKAMTVNQPPSGSLLNLVLRLRQLTTHPFLLQPPIEADFRELIRTSSKFIFLDKLVDRAVLEKGRKVIIFSEWTMSLDYVEDMLETKSQTGVKFKYLRLDGSTLRAQRNLSIHLFQDSPSHKVMLISTTAGGIGITLTAATNVVFLDHNWNPQHTLQAEARAHRIGQTQPVTIYKLFLCGTIEEQMMSRVTKKLFLSAKITESANHIHVDQDERSTQDAARGAGMEDLTNIDSKELSRLLRMGTKKLIKPITDDPKWWEWSFEKIVDTYREKDEEDDLANEEEDDGVGKNKELMEWLLKAEKISTSKFEGREMTTCEDKKHSALEQVPDLKREDRRIGKETTVLVDGFPVLKESINCSEGEARPPIARKDNSSPSGKDDETRKYSHQTICHICKKDNDLIHCRICPRSYHRACVEPIQGKKTQKDLYCPQHSCKICKKKAADAGGLLYRCAQCEQAFCEDDFELVGNNLEELDRLGYETPENAYFILCNKCQVDDGAQSSEVEESSPVDPPTSPPPLASSISSTPSLLTPATPGSSKRRFSDISYNEDAVGTTVYGKQRNLSSLFRPHQTPFHRIQDVSPSTQFYDASPVGDVANSDPEAKM